LGESEGEFADSDFSSNVDDLVAAANYLRREYRAPGLLIGHSLGGAAVLLAAAKIPEAKAVATIGAPSDTKHLRASLIQGAPELASTDEAEIELEGRKFTIKRRFLEDLEAQNVEQQLDGLRVPLLVLHSPTDETVAIEHARRIYDAARHPKSFVSLDGADHLLREPRDARFVAGLLAVWSARYLIAEASDQHAGRVPPGTVQVRGGRSGYAVEIETASHRLAADEPLDVGGTNTGPNPYELLLSALGACMTITARLYADRKGWPLTGTIARLAHDRMHAEDCADCETKEGLIDRIAVDIEFQGSLSDGQRQRLREIAGRCPVHRTLTSEIVIAE
jgi:putative redox protein